MIINFNEVNVLQLLTPDPKMCGTKFGDAIRHLHALVDMLDSEFLNLFDNYVCYNGEKEETQFRHFCADSHTRVLSLVDVENDSDFLVVERILKSIYSKLASHYFNVNKMVAQAEEILNRDIVSRILVSLSQKLDEILEQDQDIAGYLEKNLVQYFSAMINRVADFSARTNRITNNSIEAMKADIRTRLSNAIHVQNCTRPNRDQVTAALQNYERKLKFETMLVSDPLVALQLHEEACKNIIANLGAVEKPLVSQLMDLKFLNALNMIEGIESPDQHNLPCIVVHVTVDGETIFLSEENFTKFSLGLLMEHNHEKVNIYSIIRFGRTNQKNDKKYEDFISFIFRGIKKEAGNFGFTQDAVITVVPGWLSSSDIVMLSYYIHEAGFKTCYFVRETAMVALTLMISDKFQHDTCVVVTSNDDRVTYDIYEAGGEIIRLAGVSISQTHAALKVSQSDCKTEVGVFQEQIRCASKTAERLLEARRTEKEKIIVFLNTDNCPAWKEAFMNFLAKNKPSFHLKMHPDFEDYTTTFTTLCTNSKILCENVVDYWVVPDGKIFEASKSFNQSPHTSKAIYRGSNRLRKELIDSCENIQQQINHEKVHLTRFLQKLVKQKLSKAMTVAQSSEYGSHDVSKQVNIIREIKKLHGFS